MQPLVCQLNSIKNLRLLNLRLFLQYRIKVLQDQSFCFCPIQNIQLTSCNWHLEKKKQFFSRFLGREILLNKSSLYDISIVITVQNSIRILQYHYCITWYYYIYMVFFEYVANYISKKIINSSINVLSKTNLSVQRVY